MRGVSNEEGRFHQACRDQDDVPQRLSPVRATARRNRARTLTRAMRPRFPRRALQSKTSRDELAVTASMTSNQELNS